jgi:hypothetical protein
LVIFYDEKVDYCKVTNDDSEIGSMISTTKSEFDTIRSNNGWMDLNDNEERKRMEGLVKLYKVREQALGIRAIYCGASVQWTKMIEAVPQIWSTTLRTTFEDQWKDNLEEDINNASSMFGRNME